MLEHCAALNTRRSGSYSNRTDRHQTTGYQELDMFHIPALNGQHFKHSIEFFKTSTSLANGTTDVKFSSRYFSLLFWTFLMKH